MVIDDLLGLPRVTREAIDEYARRRREIPGYVSQSINAMERANPELVKHMWLSASLADSDEERTDRMAVFVNTYVLLSIQAELDQRGRAN